MPFSFQWIRGFGVHIEWFFTMPQGNPIQSVGPGQMKRPTNGNTLHGDTINDSYVKVGALEGPPRHFLWLVFQDSGPRPSTLPRFGHTQIDLVKVESRLSWFGQHCYIGSWPTRVKRSIYHIDCERSGWVCMMSRVFIKGKRKKMKKEKKKGASFFFWFFL